MAKVKYTTYNDSWSDEQKSAYQSTLDAQHKAGVSGNKAIQAATQAALALTLTGQGVNGTTSTGTTTNTSTGTTSTTGTVNSNTTVIPGEASTDNPNAMNVVDYAAQVATNPSLAISSDDPNTATNESMSVSDRTSTQTPDVSAGTIDGTKDVYNIDTSDPSTQVTASTVSNVATPTAASYEVATTADKVAENQLVAAQGTLSDGSIVKDSDLGLLDTEAIANGETATGQALNDFASINLSNVIDTSTPEGKAAAEAAGVNGYVDSKATVQGQLEQLQKQFTDANGNPTIPVWASATAREIQKTIAFSGMSGTAATAALATALQEASITIATKDAEFFQTLTVQNLSNEQQQTINKATVLANMDMKNADSRTAAAIQNAQSFLAMDLKNLDNEQQAAVINNQNYVNSILEDAKQENAKRAFDAQSENDMTKYYDSLNATISQFNASQTQEASKFNATMEDSRQKYYAEMQYNIDVANAQWRQTVELNEDKQAYEAATTDVKNLIDIQTSQLNQIWDRSDSLLEYVWNSSENEKNRQNQLAIANLTAQTQIDLANMKSDDATTTAIGSLIGTFVGSDAGSKAIASIFS